jgi:hypothetical protein
MLKKILMLMSGILIFTLQAVAFGSYPSAQYPNVPAFNEKKANGVFHLQVQKDGKWVDAGQIGLDKYFRQRSLDISSYAESGKTVKIRLTKDGGGLAHIDSILLNTRSPLSASNRDTDIKKFAKDDFDVADASGKGMEFEFSAEEGKVIISLTARIEEEVISKTPFQYPTANLYKEMGHNSTFYTYNIDKIGKSAEKEIFKEYSVSGSGHPSGYTYGKVSNDKDNLYVTIDFTPDDTMDGDKDYAKVYVKTGALLREFKVTAVDERWGKAHFTYTDNVTYEHKLYTFQIPLTEVGDAKEIEMAFSAYGTASPPGGDFGTATRQYLVTYDRNGDIYGRLVGENGVAVGGEFIICNAASSQFYPSVAFNSATNQYLVTWTDDRNGASDIYGQLVNANGSLSGGNFFISNAVDRQFYPSVAYNSSTNQFLVAWEDARNGSYDIYGQLVNSNGSLSGGNFVISNAANSQYWPSVAFNSSTNQFLAVWQDGRSGTNTDIYGQLVNANGSLSGGDFVISNAADNQNAPSVAFNSSANQFLAAWLDYRSGTNWDIYGQLINSNGSLSGGNLIISNAAGDQYEPSVAYNSSTNQFLVGWTDYRSGTTYDIYGQLLNSNGSLSGGEVLIQNNAYSPQAIANAFCPNYLIAFYDIGIRGYSWTLFGEPCQSTPTMNEWGMIIFAALAGLGSVYYLRRRYNA